MATTLVWFRQDLRLQDNAALAAAVKRGPVVPVHVFDPDAEGRWPLGAAARWWLHHSLAALDDSLRERGSRLILARGTTEAELTRIARATGADAVYWSRRYEPAAVRQENAVTSALTKAGLSTTGFDGSLLFDPAEVRNQQGKPFQVFTPFWRFCRTLRVPEPGRLVNREWSHPTRWPASVPLAELELRPRVRWDAGMAATWQPGEAAALKQLRQFARDAIAGYATERDKPAVAGTSRLSPHLHFGEISPRQVWSAVMRETEKRDESGVAPAGKGGVVYLSEIGWREFGYHLLVHFPQTPDEPLRATFDRFPWAADPGGTRWKAWIRGRTGYPIVDAGTRELWRTGWMHNRVRMITASFLVKHLRLPWTKGAAWFWDTLVDADLANNTLGWQWSAGCGADAAPYFRIFAPVTQSRKFDGAGEYIRRWVPELERMPAEHIHAPWLAPADVLTAAGVRLGTDYPLPVVDHAAARAEALAAFRKMRDNAAE